MLEVKHLNISKISEERTLIKDLSFVLNKGDKFAIIGMEGSGKSSLIKAICNKSMDYVEVDGHITHHKHLIGNLSQSIDHQDLNLSLMDYVLKSDSSNTIDIEQYQYFHAFNQLLYQMQFDMIAFDEDKLMKQYSGGELVKIRLAKILMKNPDILCLDEPTNDLDLETVLFLENFIKNEKRPILFISHDERLIETCANGIIHLVQTHKKTKAITYFEKMDYQSYQHLRHMKFQSQMMIAKKQRSDYQQKLKRFRQIFEKVQYQQNQVVRAPAVASKLAKKMKNLKSQSKRLEKEKSSFLDIPEGMESIDLFFDDAISISNHQLILDYQHQTLKINDRVLASNISLHIKGPQKICIIGNNGIGKSTLLHEIHKYMQNNRHIKIGYMPQKIDPSILDQHLLSYLSSHIDNYDEAKTRKTLGSLHFTTDEMYATIRSLSGGQQAKLMLLRFVLDGSNVLLLDEPTRNLSPLSTPTIYEMLSHFKGAIICITHDRTFIEQVFNDIYILSKQGLKLQ